MSAAASRSSGLDDVGAPLSSRSCVPRTVITTHFREVGDLDLLRAGSVASGGIGRADENSGASEPRVVTPGADVPVGAAAAVATAVTPDVAFFQMQVMLDQRVSGAGDGSRSLLDPGLMGSSFGLDGPDDGKGSLAEFQGRAATVPYLEDTVVPLFKLAPGHAASSYGLACAAKAGMLPDVVRRAHDVTEQLRTHAPVEPIAAVIGGTRGGTGCAELAVAKALLEVQDWQLRDVSELQRAMALLRALPA
jgi:hypothetical protein